MEPGTVGTEVDFEKKLSVPGFHVFLPRRLFLIGTSLKEKLEARSAT
jgi:hypothetical protein